jgi:F-type H+-transporting ATPase subunit a
MYHFTWLEQIPGIAGAFEAAHLGSSAGAILHAWLLSCLLIGAALLGRMKLNSVIAAGGDAQYVPDSSLTMRNFWELFVGGLDNLTHSVLSHDNRKPVYFALLSGLFIFILFGNLMGMVPGFAAPTGDFNTNLAMALVVLVVFNVAGLMANGAGHITHLFGPIWWLAPLIFVVEALGMFLVRPFSLTLRLTGNMFGDHMVFGIMSDLVPPVLPSVFLGLGSFVSFIQALVFTLLSAVYIALATAHDDDHH